MTTVSMCEAQEQLPQLVERVAQGEQIIIVKDGRRVAMLVPAPQEVPRDEEKIKQVVKEMLEYRDRQKRTLGGISVRELIEEGRRY